MKKIYNKTMRTLYIGMHKINPKETIYFHDYSFSSSDLKKIYNFKNYGFITVFDVDQPTLIEPEIISQIEESIIEPENDQEIKSKTKSKSRTKSKIKQEERHE